jgi:protein SCO1/2
MRGASWRRRAFATLLPFALLAAGTAGAEESGAEAPALRAGVFDPPRAAPAFRLTGSDGEELRLERYRGKVVILGFGFTSCTDVCPTTLATLAGARKRLGAEAGDVQVVYLTVDPERDDAVRLRQYLRGFDPSFVGGTGSAEQLAAVRRDYGIAAEKVILDSGHSFSHSSYTYLIDREGKLRALMPYGHPADDYAHDVRLLLAQ